MYIRISNNIIFTLEIFHEEVFKKKTSVFTPKKTTNKTKSFKKEGKGMNIIYNNISTMTSSITIL